MKIEKTSSQETDKPRKSQSTKAGGKRHKRNYETFTKYIYISLKGIHPEISISKKTMKIMNSFISDILEIITSEAIKLVRFNKKRTLTSYDI